MGEMILREEGYEVVSVTDGETALLRLRDVDPDLVMVDAFLPRKSGFEICRHLKSTPRHQHARVILLAGLLEAVDDEEVRRCGSDALIRKPFEASAVAKTVNALVREAQLARGLFADEIHAEQPLPEPPAAVAAPPKPVIDPERVEAAVTIALDAAMPALIREITERVLIALGH